MERNPSRTVSNGYSRWSRRRCRRSRRDLQGISCSSVSWSSEQIPGCSSRNGASHLQPSVSALKHSLFLCDSCNWARFMWCTCVCAQRESTWWKSKARGNSSLKEPKKYAKFNEYTSWREGSEKESICSSYCLMNDMYRMRSYLLKRKNLMLVEMAVVHEWKKIRKLVICSCAWFIYDMYIGKNLLLRRPNKVKFITKRVLLEAVSCCFQEVCCCYQWYSTYWCNQGY